MSDVPAKNFGPSILRVGDMGADSKPSSFAPRRQESAFASTPTRGFDLSARASLVVTAPPTLTVGKIFGFLFLLAGVLLATISFETWGRWVGWIPAQFSWIPAPWTTDSGRWITVAVLAVTGLLFLPSRAISVVVSSVFFAVTAYGADRLLSNRASGWIIGYLGAGAPRSVLAIGSLVFGYWTQVGSSGALNLRGIFGLALTLLAAFGTIHGWYDWSPIAERLGPGVIKILKEWGQECTWATVLVLTALGVSSSRTRPIHFLIAVLLGALAYHCVREGYYELHTFPDLSKGGKLVSCESMSYANVARWRWIAASEMTLLAAILLHLAAGVGGLSMAVAVGWMLTALAIYHSVGNMALIRTATDAFGSSRVDPLANMGIPTGPALPKPGSESKTANGRANVMVIPPQGPVKTITVPSSSFDFSTRQALVREVAPMAWMFLTAVFAGLIAVSGFNLLSDHGGYRSFFNSALWFGFGIALTALLWVWPRDPDRSWEAWLASGRMSRYHSHMIWLIFLGTMAVGSMFSMAKQGRASTWVHVGAAAAFVGTAASLATIAMLIYFGGFSPLPSWVYVVVAVVQSSLGWMLLTNHSFARLPSQRRIT